MSFHYGAAAYPEVVSRTAYDEVEYVPHREVSYGVATRPVTVASTHTDNVTTRVSHPSTYVAGYSSHVDTSVGPLMGVHRGGRLGRVHRIRKSRNVRPVVSTIRSSPVYGVTTHDDYVTQPVAHTSYATEYEAVPYSTVSEHLDARPVHYEVETRRYSGFSSC